MNGVTYIGGAGLNPNAEGSIRINSSNFNAPIISFGGFGKGELSLFQDAVLKTTEINRNAQARPSTINLNGGTIQLTASQPELFGNFTSTDVISINNLGGTIETLANNVNIFDKAVIGGSGNFIKKGTGLLAMNTASKAWTGETHIDQGTLKLNGDYAMRDGEVLAVGLNTADDYGKLLVDGNADISKGKLQINASQAVQAMPNSSTWLNVVKATARNGQFATLSDNSPLVDFYADYSDPTAVHIKLGTTPTPTPMPTPTPTPMSTGRPSNTRGTGTSTNKASTRTGTRSFMLPGSHSSNLCRHTSSPRSQNHTHPGVGVKCAGLIIQPAAGARAAGTSRLRLCLGDGPASIIFFLYCTDPYSLVNQLVSHSNFAQFITPLLGSLRIIYYRLCTFYRLLLYTVAPACKIEE